MNPLSKRTGWCALAFATAMSLTSIATVQAEQVPINLGSTVINAEVPPEVAGFLRSILPPPPRAKTPKEQKLIDAINQRRTENGMLPLADSITLSCNDDFVNRVAHDVDQTNRIDSAYSQQAGLWAGRGLGILMTDSEVKSYLDRMSNRVLNPSVTSIETNFVDIRTTEVLCWNVH